MATEYKLGTTRGLDKIQQLEHALEHKAKAVTHGVLSPGDVIDITNITTQGVEVKKGSLLRIMVNGNVVVAFGDASIGAVSSSTSPSLLIESGTFHVRATDDYIRADSAMVTRIERVID